MWDQGGRNVPLEMLMGLLSAGKALWEERGWRWLWAGPAEGTDPGRQEPGKAHESRWQSEAPAPARDR